MNARPSCVYTRERWERISLNNFGELSILPFNTLKVKLKNVSIKRPQIILWIHTMESALSEPGMLVASALEKTIAKSNNSKLFTPPSPITSLEGGWLCSTDRIFCLIRSFRSPFRSSQDTGWERVKCDHCGSQAGRGRAGRVRNVINWKHDCVHLTGKPLNNDFAAWTQ